MKHFLLALFLFNYSISMNVNSLNWFTNVSRINQHCKSSLNDVVIQLGIKSIFIGSAHEIKGVNGKNYIINTFLGIPYAEAAVGNLRFQLPRKYNYSNSANEWCFKKFQHGCIQNQARFEYNLPGDYHLGENCLFLNIYFLNSTSESALSPYPVLIHIHGGSYILGSSHLYPGFSLASQGLVVVTFNYRLGPFGFLSTGTKDAPGNMGLADQRLVMDWVQENIHWFHGNPDNVTIMGESAGAASVAIHLLSQKKNSEKLRFHRAIIISGSDISPWASLRWSKERHLGQAIHFGRTLNCTSNDILNQVTEVNITEMVECLRTKSVEEIAFAENNIQDHERLQEMWTPKIYDEPESDFIARSRLDLVHSSKPSPVPLLIGCMSSEASAKLAYMLHKWMKIDVVTDKANTRSVFISSIMKLLASYHEPHRQELAARLEDEYINTKNKTQPIDYRKELIAVSSDYLITSPTYRAAVEQLEVTTDVYFFLFDYRSVNETQPRLFGVYHGSETPFLFGYSYMTTKLWNSLYTQPVQPTRSKSTFQTPADMEMSSLMALLWINFVKTGNPTPEPVNGFIWTPFSEPSRPYLYLGAVREMRLDYRRSYMDFWSSCLHHQTHAMIITTESAYLSFLVVIILILLATLVALITCRRQKQFHPMTCIQQPRAAGNDQSPSRIFTPIEL